MNERVVRFGAGASLVGIVTDPATAMPGSGRPAVLLLNAGQLHRIGPHRINVGLARRVAEAGHLALRFDFSGLGDSGPRRDGVPYPESAVLEARDAMDYLSAERGVSRFVLVGSCSGADNAFRVACADTRVCGAFLLDWFPYRTFGWYRRQLGSMLQRALHDGRGSGTLKRAAAELGDLLRLATSFKRDGGAADRRAPSRHSAAAELRRLLTRGVWLRFVYTGGQQRYVNDARQFREAFGALALDPHVSVAYWPDADHTLTLLAWQETLIGAVARWLETVPSTGEGCEPPDDGFARRHARIADMLEHFIRRQFSVADADGRFTRSAPLFDLGYIDSIGVVELLAFVGKEWGVEIPDPDLLSEEFTTIDGIAGVVQRLSRTKPSPSHAQPAPDRPQPESTDGVPAR